MKYNLLKGKNGIIFGVMNEKSIAWKVAKACSREGANLVLTNTLSGSRLGNINKLSNQIKSKLVICDTSSLKDIKKLFSIALDYFNKKIDFLLHSIAMSFNIRRNMSYTHINYDLLTKGWNISSVSFHKIMQIAWDLDAINKYGSIVALTYIASHKFVPYYNDMSDYKSYLESVSRNFGYYWANKRKVRVNTVSQSPTYTQSSTSISFFKKLYAFSQKTSPLGNASGKDCANYIVTLFSDLTRKVTMQNLYHDGGFSSVIL